MNRRFFFLLIFLLFKFDLTDAQDTTLDSLILTLSDARDTTRVNILNSIGEQLYGSDPEEAIRYENEAVELAQRIGYTKGLAYALKNLGLSYFMISNFVEASLYWEQSLEVFQSLEDDTGIANITSNLGAAYSYMGDDAKAVDFLLKSLKIAEDLGDSMRMATCLLNIGSIYSFKPETVDQAFPYYLRALKICESINYVDGIGMSALNIGDYYYQMKAYDSALYFFNRSMIYETTIHVASSLNNIGKIYAERGDFAAAIKNQQQALRIAESMDGKLEMAQIHLGLANTYRLQGDIQNAITEFEKAKRFSEDIESNYELKDAYEGLAGVYAELSDYKRAYEYQTLLNDVEKTIYSIETDDKIKNLNFTYQLEKKEDEIEILEQQAEIEQLKTRRQKAVSIGIGMAGILLLLLAVALYNRFKFAQKARRTIQKEKDRSDNLLLNILPSKTAEELKEKGTAKARKYESVTILFTDFKEFTSIAADLDPEVLVDEINQCYVKFDEIVTKYGVEKIKTIGDAYMAAGGLPVPNRTHPVDVVKAAVEIRDFMLQLKKQRERENRIFFEIRIGVHTGPVVAGIVGTKKFAYDIWGDTVNCAARMESCSEPGRINISESTYQQIKNDFKCEFRGEFEAKNRGKMRMYFVEHPVQKAVESIY